ncbi:hypothetical protein NY406_00195 [Chlorobaculum sp. MV4-Y]|uniref:hypothetical protein n=1 Tax=Chlorobaculum sp. MV4-Y TaxID=2976335 RepID=UPI0021AE6F1D|nr:hypothetical protein [Chlorobaculum sp. MV4-Y]UWX57755.1 hypothetical protein NY406_00195 [Chlorobaculum sp. MV4-Y]
MFDHNGVTYHLPQLELARVLFFHHAYLARLSLINQRLAQEFDVLQTTGANKAQLNILPTCTLPLYVRENYALRRALAWILLDDDARRSFESIARYQLQHGYDTEQYRLWCFSFDPPRLEGVELTVRGHFDQKLQAFFFTRYMAFSVWPATLLALLSLSIHDLLKNDQLQGVRFCPAPCLFRSWRLTMIRRLMPITLRCGSMPRWFPLSSQTPFRQRELASWQGAGLSVFKTGQVRYQKLIWR